VRDTAEHIVSRVTTKGSRMSSHDHPDPFGSPRPGPMHMRNGVLGRVPATREAIPGPRRPTPAIHTADTGEITGIGDLTAAGGGRRG